MYLNLLSNYLKGTIKKWKYLDNEFLINSPWINLSSYGISKKNKYHPTDNQRKYIQVPLNQSNQDLISVLKNIDNHIVNNEDLKRQILGDKFDKFEYTPLYKSKEDKPGYIKSKLDTEIMKNRPWKLYYIIHFLINK